MRGPCEQRLVEKPVAHPTVKAVAEAVLYPIARCDVAPLNAYLPALREHGIAHRFDAVVSHDYAGLAALGNRQGKCEADPETRDQCVRHRSQALYSHVADDVEHADPSF